MGVFKKLKDVLFDDVEEEVEETEIEIESEATREIRQKFEKQVEKKPEPESKPKIKQEINTITEIKIPKDDIPERELVKSESTFNFPMEVEEELAPPRRSRIIEDEYDSPSRKRVADYSSAVYDNLKKEPKEVKKQFKPTPIISPVYGILDHNYSKDDVIIKTDIGVKGPDLDAVRKKAYGIELADEPKEAELPNLKMEEEIIEPIEELEVIPEKAEELTDITTLIQEVPVSEPEPEAKEDVPLEDTLETDLFKLIDSMYEDKEEEDEE